MSQQILLETYIISNADLLGGWIQAYVSSFSAIYSQPMLMWRTIFFPIYIISDRSLSCLWKLLYISIFLCHFCIIVGCWSLQNLDILTARLWSISYWDCSLYVNQSIHFASSNKLYPLQVVYYVTDEEQRA